MSFRVIADGANFRSLTETVSGDSSDDVYEKYFVLGSDPRSQEDKYKHANLRDGKHALRMFFANEINIAGLSQSQINELWFAILSLNKLKSAGDYAKVIRSTAILKKMSIKIGKAMGTAWRKRSYAVLRMSKPLPGMEKADAGGLFSSGRPTFQVKPNFPMVWHSMDFLKQGVAAAEKSPHGSGPYSYLLVGDNLHRRKDAFTFIPGLWLNIIENWYHNTTLKTIFRGSTSDDHYFVSQPGATITVLAEPFPADGKSAKEAHPDHLDRDYRFTDR